MKRIETTRILLVASMVMAISACTQHPTNGSDGKASPEASAHASHAPAANATPRIPDHRTRVEDRSQLPKTLDPSRFSTPHVALSYRIARDIPEVLAQQPCYCYCDAGFGHGSLLDCHIDDHSAGCTVCLKETLLADQLNRQGKTAENIRDAIVRGDWRNIELK